MDTRIIGVLVVGLVVGLGASSARAGECGACAVMPAAAGDSTLTAEEQRAAEKLRKEGLGFISVRELSERIAAGKAPVVVDVLDGTSFAKQHVKGAINIPYKEVSRLAPTLLPEKDAEIVVYCGSYKCTASTAAGKALKELGYTNVRDYKGGIKEWTEKGLPVGGTAAK